MARSPLRVTARGAFTAAMESAPSGAASTHARASSRSRSVASIAPRPASLACRRPRWCAGDGVLERERARGPRRRDLAGAVAGDRPGVMPSEAQSSTSATCSASSRAARSPPRPCASRPRRAQLVEERPPPTAVAGGVAALDRRAGDGSRASSSRPIAHHCGPMPGEDERGGRRRGAAPRGDAPAGGAEVVPRTAASASRSSAAESLTTASRPGDGGCARWDGRAAATAAASSRRRSRRVGVAAGELAERPAAARGERQHEVSGAVAGARRCAGRRGAARAPSSSTACAFVPPKPKELTAARAAASAAASVRRARHDASSSAIEVDRRVRRLEVQVRRHLPCARQSTALIRPATPAAASRWPMLVLTEPIRQGRSAGR